jgi:sugar transferase (PEP-CTERM/EpsH1 system associated)
MKILWVKGGGLVPPDTGGKIRSYNLLRELAQKHSVTYFGFHDARENDAQLKLSEMVERAVCVPLALPSPKSGRELVEYARSFFGRTPYGVHKFCRPQVPGQLRKVLAEQSFDVVVCDFLLPAPVIPWDIPTPKVLFAHNVEAMIWKRHYNVSRNPLWKLMSWREWKMTERLEREYTGRADQVIAVSDADRDVFAQWISAEKLSVVPTGVDSSYFEPSDVEALPNSLIFTGSMDWLPNEDSMNYFIEQILPLIRTQIPEVRLRIVGRRPSKRLQALAARHANIHLTGWVEDVRPHLSEAAVAIVPLRIGGGTRLKIFEAMAMAKPVVSTTLGAEGLPVEHGENIVLADTPVDFAGEVVGLLRNPARAREIGLAAHRLVKERYSWAAVARQFGEILERVLERASVVSNS